MLIIIIIMIMIIIIIIIRSPRKTCGFHSAATIMEVELETNAVQLQM